MKVRAVRRMVPKPSARQQEQMAALRLYSTAARQVTAVPRTPPDLRGRDIPQSKCARAVGAAERADQSGATDGQHE